MLRKVIGLTMLFLLLIGGTVLARTPDEARMGLAQLKLDFNDQVFLQKIIEKDNYAVSLFLDAGMNPNLITGYGNTPLKIAAIYNNADAVKILLTKESIDINWRDSMGRSAIDVAYLFGNNAIVDILKEKGAAITVNKTFELFPEQIQQALTTGETSANNKQDIIFTEMDTDKTRGGFLGGDIKTMARAYLVPPFCAIANERMKTAKKYEGIQQDKINLLANTYEVRIVISVTNTNTAFFDGLKIVGLQNGKVLLPYGVEPIPVQVTQNSGLFGTVYWYRFGYIARFNANDIDISKPIDIKILSKASKELTLKFDNSTDILLSTDGRDEFKW